jgi:hypothetical protein
VRFLELGTKGGADHGAAEWAAKGLWPSIRGRLRGEVAESLVGPQGVAAMEPAIEAALDGVGNRPTRH